MNVFIFSPETSTTHYYRAKLTKRFFDRHPELDVRVEVSHLLPSAASGYDVLQVVYSTANPTLVPLIWLDEWREAGAALVVDCDDLVFDIPTWHPYMSKWLSWRVQDFFRDLFTKADLLTVTTPHLKKQLSRFVPTEIRDIPNAYDPLLKIHRPVSPGQLPKRVDTTPIVGFAGGAQHLWDLHVMTPVWKELIRAGCLLQFMGCDPPDIIGKPGTSFLPGTGGGDPEPYYQALAHLEWDVAVAPLAEHPANHCKSPIKVLEYRNFIGCPVVCTKSPTYAQVDDDWVTRVEGYDPKRWAAAVYEAIELGGSRGRKYSLPPEFLLDSAAPAWQKAWSEASAIAKTRSAEPKMVSFAPVRA